MPSIIKLFGYNIYFWSNEGKPIEPVHVHISEIPTKNATKVWILSDGSPKLDNNNSNIKKKDLKRILDLINIFSDDIIKKWEEYFGVKAAYIDEYEIGADLEL